MRWYDVTLPISPELLVWPGDPPVRVERVLEPTPDQPFTVSRLEMSSHTGTHIDAPRHIFPQGSGVDTLPPDILIGPAYVIDARGFEVLSAQTLETLQIPQDATRVLFLTDNSVRGGPGRPPFRQDFVAFDFSGARWVVKHGIRLIGVDSLSVAVYGAEIPVHRHLLAAEVVIVEGLDLRHVLPGLYDMYCLPLRLLDGDGAPARVLLRDT